MSDTGFIDIMPWRLSNLEATVRAYTQTGAPLVRITPGGYYGPANPTDDPGLFLFAPPLARLLGLSAAGAKDALLALIVLVALIAGALGLWRSLTTTAGRVIGLIGAVGLALVCLELGDVYLTGGAAALAVLPWLYRSTLGDTAKRLMWLAAPLGLVAALSNLMRSHAGTTVAIAFVVALVATPKLTIKERLVPLALMLTGLAVVAGMFSVATGQRDAFLRTVPADPQRVEVGHPLWHTIYIGLGYIPNRYGLAYDDNVALDRVAKVAPGEPMGSPRYEEVLRTDVMRLASSDPLFILRVEASKILRLLLYLVAFANIGLVGMLWARPGRAVWMPLVAALAFSALAPIISVPRPDYSAGFIGVAVIIGLVGIDLALAKRRRLRESA